MDYYSFRNDYKNTNNELFYYKHNSNIIFKHDLTAGIPKIYNKCDLLYTEPSWLVGYKIFCKRANMVPYGDYKKYISMLSNLTYGKKTIVMIIGKSAIKNMNQNYSKIRVKMNNYWETAYGWNIDLSKYNESKSFEFIKQLSNDYNNVGDFCCGFGNTGRIFKENGKNFIMSDISGEVVYKTAIELMDYESI